jgi:1-aminocyclopropane-1-carboxylate deaminase/D-cysteine desulfhydrase-like pyridoxal-dependent ACC family enzyme
MSVHLILGGKRAAESRGNVLLEEMLGAQIHYLDSPEWNDWEAESARLAANLEVSGRKVFRMPIGGSVPLGVAGYAGVFLEILKDQERLNTSFDHIIHASGSGGTQAGLIAGKEMTGWAGRITGISVAMDRESLENKVFELARETAALLGNRVGCPSVLVNDEFIGEGYAVRTEEAEKAIEVFARREGIFLDHVYTGKAAGALLKWLERGDLSGQKVLFLHTGGQVELFS